MSRVPRIVRAVPAGAVTRPEHPVEVVARLHWHRGADTEVPALAVAWTREAVEIAWTTPWGDERTDWVEAVDVRRA